MVLDPSRHLACSGATINDVLKAGQEKLGPDDVAQVKRLADLNKAKRVDVVTVTIGGNDLDFAGILTQCFVKNGPVGCASNLPNEFKRINSVVTRVQRVCDAQ